MLKERELEGQLTRSAVGPVGVNFQPPTFATLAEERQYRKERLAGAFRLFSRFGFDEGVAGHITARDPERTDCFWVNPFGMHFGQIRASDLILVSHEGEVIEGKMPVNRAAFAIHSAIHQARPDVNAIAHTHSTFGRAWSSLGRLLDPITQDSCAFFEDHAILEDYTGVVYDEEEGQKLAAALGQKKAIILQNHGILTVGQTVEAAAWFYITMERTCQVQLLAEAAGTPKLIEAETARTTRDQIAYPMAGWFQFQPLWQRITREQPDLFD